MCGTARTPERATIAACSWYAGVVKGTSLFSDAKPTVSVLPLKKPFWSRSVVYPFCRKITCEQAADAIGSSVHVHRQQSRNLIVQVQNVAEHADVDSSCALITRDEKFNESQCLERTGPRTIFQCDFRSTHARWWETLEILT